MYLRIFNRLLLFFHFALKIRFLESEIAKKKDTCAAFCLFPNEQAFDKLNA